MLTFASDFWSRSSAVLADDSAAFMAETGASTCAFCLISNLRSVDLSRPFEIMPGAYLRKATSNESAVFHELFSESYAGAVAPIRNPYETRAVLVGATDRAAEHFEYAPLPESEFRYHVLALVGGNAAIYGARDVVEASVLTPWHLEEGPHITMNRGRVGIRWNRNHPIFMEEAQYTDDQFIPLTESYLAEISSVLTRLKAFAHPSVRLREAVRAYSGLRAIPEDSPFRFLGYVSVLESVITHSPKPTDPYDSLTRQVRQKMLLLERRFRQPLPYEIFLGSVDHGRLWNLLYAYRSAVAHGAQPDFAKELKVLKSPGKALSFMRTATSLLLRQALDEPELVGDLHQC